MKKSIITGIKIIRDISLLYICFYLLNLGITFSQEMMWWRATIRERELPPLTPRQAKILCETLSLILVFYIWRYKFTLSPSKIRKIISDTIKRIKKA